MESSKKEEEVNVKVKLSTLQEYRDALIDYTGYTKIEEATAYYGHL